MGILHVNAEMKQKYAQHCTIVSNYIFQLIFMRMFVME